MMRKIKLPYKRFAEIGLFKKGNLYIDFYNTRYNLCFYLLEDEINLFAKAIQAKSYEKFELTMCTNIYRIDFDKKHIRFHIHGLIKPYILKKKVFLQLIPKLKEYKFDIHVLGLEE